MKNGNTEASRLEGFISKIEDFHRLMNFMEVGFLQSIIIKTVFHCIIPVLKDSIHIYVIIHNFSYVNAYLTNSNTSS